MRLFVCVCVCVDNCIALFIHHQLESICVIITFSFRLIIGEDVVFVCARALNLCFFIVAIEEE